MKYSAVFLIATMAFSIAAGVSGQLGAGLIACGFIACAICSAISSLATFIGNM